MFKSTSQLGTIWLLVRVVWAWRGVSARNVLRFLAVFASNSALFCRIYSSEYSLVQNCCPDIRYKRGQDRPQKLRIHFIQRSHRCKVQQSIWNSSLFQMVDSKEPPGNYLCEEMLWKDRLFCCELSRGFCPETAIQYESFSHLFIERRPLLSWSTWGIGDVNELPRFARASGYQRLDEQDKIQEGGHLLRIRDQRPHICFLRLMAQTSIGTILATRSGR